MLLTKDNVSPLIRNFPNSLPILSMEDLYRQVLEM